MPSFDLDTDLSEDRAFRLVTNGHVSLYWRHEVLDDTTTWLADHAYQLVRLDAAVWSTEADFHRHIRVALHFPDYYGDNLDAFNDCMRDVATYTYGADRNATGTVLVFTGYDAFTRHETHAAQVILDIIADQSRQAMLFGHRLMCLVQSNDPDIHFEPVGATPVDWNPAEQLADARRG
ncbi:barstar family protein [Actinophytocola oryzae]|uniref:barstar family protein n=1 Tax=Actinophytocola oryzae TaxID=502181 RepID=UPI0010632916|nr:barstar family protein [Actinophytocola oryzae]